MTETHQSQWMHFLAGGITVKLLVKLLNLVILVVGMDAFYRVEGNFVYIISEIVEQ